MRAGSHIDALNPVFDSIFIDTTPQYL